MYNILLLGSGGREDALRRALTTSAAVDKIIWAPGNAGAPMEVRRKLDITDFPAVVKLAQSEHCQFICVGPEQPLCDGLVDYVAGHAPDIKVFGPSKAAAEFEADKHLLKQLAKRYGIRTADYQVAMTLEGVERALNDWGFPVVLKYPYLAAGKGVKVVREYSPAMIFATEVLGEKFGRKKLLVEKFIPGRELSFFAVCNGEEGVPFGDACDYKLATDKPGENRMTGGMGSYSPALWASLALKERVRHEILNPLVRAMAAEGRPYRGILYLGLMIDPEGNPWLIEVNCRGGDPEMQVILPRLNDGVFVDLLLWSVGAGPKPDVTHKDLCAVYTVLCATGYPDAYEKGYPIGGITEAEQLAMVMHAGTEVEGDRIVGKGGRVLGTLGLASRMGDARGLSLMAAERIAEHSNGKLRFRPDIAEGL